MPIAKHAAGRELLWAYPIPVGLAVLAWIPIDILRGILFSVHGGLGWLLLLVGLPWVLVRVVVVIFQTEPAARAQRWMFGAGVLLGYAPVSVLCAYSLVFALNPPFTNKLEDVLPWFYFPVSLGLMK